MYDDLTGQRREGTAEDMRQAMRLLDALPEVDYGWPSISARDLDPLTAGLEIEAIALRNYSKHLQDEVRERGAREAAARDLRSRGRRTRSGSGRSSARSTARSRR